jgi:hypothetical protein
MTDGFDDIRAIANDEMTKALAALQQEISLWQPSFSRSQRQSCKRLLTVKTRQKSRQNNHPGSLASIRPRRAGCSRPRFDVTSRAGRP